MPSFAVFVVGLDRPGVLASVTTSLVERGCNITGATGMVPRSRFSLTFFVEAMTTSKKLETGISGDLTDLHLDVLTVEELFTEDPAPDPKQHVPLRTVQGRADDRPGVLANIARFLAEEELTVKVMLSMLTEDESREFSTTLRVQLESDREAEFEAQLAQACERVGFRELKLLPEV